jgi:hypothetical protein
MNKPPPLTVGIYWVDLPCPRCGALATVAAHLSAVLTTPTEEEPSLRLKVRSKAVDHECGQGRMLDTAELLDLGDRA